MWGNNYVYILYLTVITHAKIYAQGIRLRKLYVLG